MEEAQVPLVVRACLRVAAGKEYKIIPREEDQYMTRYYLQGKREEDDERLTNWYLHHFHRGDVDVDLHNHPWDWSCSFVLTGGYMEERLVRGRIIRRRIKPGNFNIIRHNDFHRVDLIEQDAWTLFLAGPARQRCLECRHNPECAHWGFLNRYTGAFRAWHPSMG